MITSPQNGQSTYNSQAKQTWTSTPKPPFCPRTFCLCLHPWWWFPHGHLVRLEYPAIESNPYVDVAVLETLERWIKSVISLPYIKVMLLHNVDGGPHLINRTTLRAKLRFSWEGCPNMWASLLPEHPGDLCMGLRLAIATVMHTSILKQMWSFLLFFCPD